MNCKNCNTQIEDSANFCQSCGGKVVTNRITFRQIIKDMLRNILGLDNTYLRTLKGMFVSPQLVLTDYMNGVRKRYFPPFGFFTIGAALALFAFQQFSEDYIAISQGINESQFEVIDQTLEPDKKMDQEIVQESLEDTEEIQRTILRYFNFFSFLLLPVYALMGFIVYRKPYNFGEHLVANAYMQGVTFLFTLIFFLLSLVIDPSLYMISMIFVMVYYTYAYGKWYNLSFGKSLIKLLLFLLVLIGFFLGIVLVGVVYGILKSL